MAKVDDDTLETHFALGPPVPPARRDRARDSRAREPAGAAEPQRSAAASGRVLARPRTTSARGSSTAPRSSSPSCARARRSPRRRSRSSSASTSASRNGKRPSTRTASSRCCAARSRTKSRTTTASSPSWRARPAIARSRASTCATPCAANRAQLRGTLIRATLGAGGAGLRPGDPLYEQVIEQPIGTSSPRCCRRCSSAIARPTGCRSSTRISKASSRRTRRCTATSRTPRSSATCDGSTRSRARRALRARAPRARESRQRRGAARRCRRSSAARDRANRPGLAHDRDGERALSLLELRLQHAAVHLALPELQAVGDGAADSERAARNRARAPANETASNREFALLLAQRRCLAWPLLPPSGAMAMKSTTLRIGYALALACGGFAAAAGPVNINTADAAKLGDRAHGRRAGARRGDRRGPRRATATSRRPRR